MAWVWKISYALLDSLPVYGCVQPLRRMWNMWIARRFVACLKEQRPDLVVATHFLPTDVCGAGRASGWLAAPLVVVVTDLYPHRFWISRSADAVVASTDQSAAVLERRGIARERIHVLGIPIGKAFRRSADREALRKRLHLEPGRRTVLVTSGGTTVGHFERVVASLVSLETSGPGRLQLLVVCGEDEGARARLSRRAERSSMPMRVFGFVDDMADLMAASDLIVAKAGGLTVSEALGCGVPLVLYHVIPGQERWNAEYVVGHGAAVIARHARDVGVAVDGLMEEPARLTAMREAARRLGRPDAADAIALNVVKPLLEQRSRLKADG